MHEGRLIGFSVAATVVAAGVAVVAYIGGVSVWLSVVLALILIMILTLGARRAQTRRWGFGRRRWIREHGGRTIEVVFDERLVFLNRLTLIVDGHPVDHTTIWYGTKHLRGDGVVVAVGSGWIGECLGVELCADDGSRLALSERG